MIQRIEDWPISSSGAWVVMMIREYLEQNGFNNEMQNDWFNAKVSVYGGMNSVEFVQKLVEIGNAESYADAWHEVLGIAKRMFG